MFDRTYHRRTVVIIFFCSLISCQHLIKLSIKEASINNKRISRFSNYDYKGNGMYTFLKMDFKSMTYVNEMCMSKKAFDMERGGLKNVKGVYGFSNLGYIHIKRYKDTLKHDMIIGRSYIDHGFGRYARLLVSDWSRPFDLVQWKVEYKGLNGSIAGIQLNPIEGFNRYMSIHTINFNIIKNFTISFGESSLYAGEDRGIELQYFNPTLFWVPIRENQQTNQANGFLYSGIQYKIIDYTIWLEFLLDDYQIDQDIQEPTTYGLIFGAEINRSNDFFKNLIIEYSRVSNRTYQTNGQYGVENYIHRNFPIGHYLGNDFDKIIISSIFNEKQIFLLKINPTIKISHIRDGKEGIETIWDQPWLVEENLINGVYSEKFPTEPITHITEAEISTFIEQNSNSIELGLFFQNLEGINKKNRYYSVFLRYMISFGKNFNY